MTWETDTDIYTLLCIKQITKEKLLYSTGNSTQCTMVTQMGMEIQKRGDIRTHIADSLSIQQKLTQQ